MRLIALLMLVGLVSCRSSAPAPLAPAATESATSPIQASWRVAESTESGARIVLRVAKTIATEKDLVVDFQVPTGVQVEPSSDRWTILASQIGAMEHSLALRWEATPPGDLVAILDMQGKSMGYHASIPYRFGRPAPSVTGPKTDAPNVRVGNSNLGSPVDLTKE